MEAAIRYLKPMYTSSRFAMSFITIGCIIDLSDAPTFATSSSLQPVLMIKTFAFDQKLTEDLYTNQFDGPDIYGIPSHLPMQMSHSKRILLIEAELLHAVRSKNRTDFPLNPTSPISVLEYSRPGQHYSYQSN